MQLCFLPSLLFFMPHGREFSEDLCWAVIRMTPVMSPTEIEAYTTISAGQQRRIVLRWRNTGQVKSAKDHRTRGRPRHLTPQDVAVSTSICISFSHSSSSQYIQGTIGKQCDTYLDELQDSLLENLGVEASKQTVWRALKRSGFSMKQVSTLGGISTATSHSLQLTKAAIERSAIKRAEYTAKIGWRYTPEQLVFLDESACNRKTTYCNCAWAI